METVKTLKVTGIVYLISFSLIVLYGLLADADISANMNVGQLLHAFLLLIVFVGAPIYGLVILDELFKSIFDKGESTLWKSIIRLAIVVNIGILIWSIADAWFFYGDSFGRTPDSVIGKYINEHIMIVPLGTIIAILIPLTGSWIKK